MNRNLTLAISLAAGLLGGVLSHYVTLPAVHAQAPAPNAVEIRAQRFTLVDDQGSAIGTFTVRESGPVVQRGPGYPGGNGNRLAPAISANRTTESGGTYERFGAQGALLLGRSRKIRSSSLRLLQDGER